jgi:hypothetical protein
MRHVESIPGMRRGMRGIKEKDGGGELNNDIRTLLNATMYS